MASIYIKPVKFIPFLVDENTCMPEHICLKYRPFTFQNGWIEISRWNIQETPRKHSHHFYPSIAINQSSKWIQFIDIFKLFYFFFYYLFFTYFAYCRRACGRHTNLSNTNTDWDVHALNVQNIQRHSIWARTQHANTAFIHLGGQSFISIQTICRWCPAISHAIELIK